MNLQNISYLCSRNMETAKPLVSFILTYYNLPVQMLCECIDSIRALSLTPQEREIIVIDDGSELSPMNALMHYTDEIVYIRQKHQGVSVARNTGLKMAKGMFLQIVDSDDLLLKTPYEHVIDIIRSHQDAEVVMFDFTRKAESATTVKEPHVTTGTSLLRNQNIRGTVCCYLFRKSVLGNLLFTPHIAYAEDEEFTPQLLLRAENVWSTNAKAYYYRLRNTSAVHQRDESSITKRLDDTRDIIISLHQKADTLPPANSLAMQRRVAQLTMDYLYNIITLTQSDKELHSRIEQLHNAGLYPLPQQNYSWKYSCFRRMTNTAFGRQLLLHTLPYLNRER